LPLDRKLAWIPTFAGMALEHVKFAVRTVGRVERAARDPTATVRHRRDLSGFAALYPSYDFASAISHVAFPDDAH
jgi:hypothetical protein